MWESKLNVFEFSIVNRNERLNRPSNNADMVDKAKHHVVSKGGGSESVTSI